MRTLYRLFLRVREALEYRAALRRGRGVSSDQRFTVRINPDGSMWHSRDGGLSWIPGRP